MLELCGRDGKPNVLKMKSRAWSTRCPFHSYQQNLSLQAALSIRVTSNQTMALSLKSRRGVGYLIMSYSCSTLLQGVGQPMTLSANCSPPARPPALSGHSTATRSFTRLDTMGFIWTLGKQEFHKTVTVVLKSFPDFIIFHTVCNSPSWLLKSDTQLCFGSQLWLLGASRGVPMLGWGSQCHPELSGASHQPGEPSPPCWHGRVRCCGLLHCLSTSELWDTLGSPLLSRITGKKKLPHVSKTVGKIQDEKCNQCCVFLHLKSVFFVVFAPSSVYFVVFGLFWCYPSSYQFSASYFHIHFFHRSWIYSLPFPKSCLCQKRVLCLCRTDGTTLRFALITGQMQLLFSALLTAAWWAVPLQAKDRDAVAISWHWAGPGTLQIPQTQTGLWAAWMGTDMASPSWQHKDQTPICTFHPGPQE